jgi:hypothetical protein
MRPDMHKVVVERPRWDPGSGKHGRRANLSDELLPKFEGIKRPHQNRKGLTDLLGPLKRWLQSQVGRPWNDVYSEACAVIKPDSVIRAHIKTHLLEFVERQTFMRDGKVCVLELGYHGRGVVPLDERRYRTNLFFVHPETGRLQEVPYVSKRARQARQTRPPVTVYWITRKVALRKLNGLWFECVMHSFPKQFLKGESPWRFDAAEKRMVCRSQTLDIYGRECFCVSKRQLSRRELKHHGLANDIGLIQPGTQPSARCHRSDLTIAFRGLSQIFDGSQDWIIHRRTWSRVRVQSPAQRRSSSAVEHVQIPVRLLSVVQLLNQQTRYSVSMTRKNVAGKWT